MTLRLIETFADKCDDTAMIATQFVPAMMDPVLGDYARNVPDARCARHAVPVGAEPAAAWAARVQSSCWSLHALGASLA